MKRKQGWMASDRLADVDRRMVRRVVILVVASFLVGFAAVAVVMFATAPRRDVVTVPDLRGSPVPSARRVLGQLDLTLEVGDSLPNPRVARGAVLAQSPLPGREVAPGTTVRVILSTGPERRAVPDVGSLTLRQALRLLDASGFQVTVDSVPHARAAGRVVSTTPAAGALVPVPGTVRLLVSEGPPRLAVPSLIGTPEAELAELLRQAGLRLGPVEYRLELSAADGAVLEQTPQPGDSIRMGGEVRVVVATHQLSDPQPEDQ